MTILKVISVIIVMFSLLYLVAPIRQTFANSITLLANPPTNFTCQAAPKIKAPPNLSTDLGSNTHGLSIFCPAGLVPQPMSPSSIPPSQTPISFQMNSLRVSYDSSSSNDYHYVTAMQYAGATSIGAIGSYTQEKPYVAPQVYHSLAELAVQSPFYDSNGQPIKQQVIEIGWWIYHDVLSNGLYPSNGSYPQLFVFHWINKISSGCASNCGDTCYNACGYIQYSRTAYPGMIVNMTKLPQKYAIMYYQGNWWMWYQDQWIGYFPGSIWSDKGIAFNNVSLAQWFGEVGPTPKGEMRTQMGNGLFGQQSGSASITDMHFIDSSLKESNTTVTPDDMMVTDPNCYNYANLTGSSFTYGGPGC